MNKDYNILYNNALLCCNFLNIDLVKIFGIKAIKQILKIHQEQKESNLVNLYKYSEIVNSGKLYDYIIDFFNGVYSREKIKDILFGVMFSQNQYYKDHKRMIPYKHEKEIFAKVFPFVAEAVKILKKLNYKHLSVSLQKIESFIFIDCISKELVNAGIVPLTIHDSVIVEPEHTEKAVEIINIVFQKYFQVLPSLHIEPLKNEN